MAFRCPWCDQILYNRRRPTCASCGVVLPEHFANLSRDLRLLALALARAATAPRQTAALTALADYVV